ncbi:MAG: hypothetical protein ACE5FI_14780, partial [Anaerolineales bacterium]
MRWADDGGEAPKFSNSQARAFTSTVRAQLLRRYGDDLPKRVDRAYRQWNRIVRDSIRSETALRFTVGDDSVAVPIEVVDGMPGPFVSHMGDLESGILWELILNKAL